MFQKRQRGEGFKRKKVAKKEKLIYRIYSIELTNIEFLILEYIVLTKRPFMAVLANVSGWFKRESSSSLDCNTDRGSGVVL